jgi:hypothetical protein
MAGCCELRMNLQVLWKVDNLLANRSTTVLSGRILFHVFGWLDSRSDFSVENQFHCCKLIDF